MNIVFLGLSITSSWGNGHATTYRALVRELASNGHEVAFLERDVPWYASNRDFHAQDAGVQVVLYDSLAALRQHAGLLEAADAVVVGSYVPQGAEVCEVVLENATGVAAFYDIDTPVTLARIEEGNCDYLRADLIPEFDLYLSFTGGRTLDRLESEYRAPRARPLYCSVDPANYYPEDRACRWDLGYMGTYSDDRQPALDRLLTKPAQAWGRGRFVVAGPQYPGHLAWPANVTRIEHLPPDEHRRFYNSQRITLNITRADMIAAGHSPSVRLFEAAACGRPIVSDWWEGLDEIFDVGSEILVAHDTEEMLDYLLDLPEEELVAIGEGGRRRVLGGHTAAHRAAELVSHLDETPTAHAGASR